MGNVLWSTASFSLRATEEMLSARERGSLKQFAVAQEVGPSSPKDSPTRLVDSMANGTSMSLRSPPPESGSSSAVC
ncbi:hypothetical protein [Mesorhizobium temperatum]|uniref:hypothetical protein n=1 Tax=Mesorhizobium temperatum TaxID=241416 RepID=UPI00117E5E53|nr:hypothetical protein [Mesorhizobium temperatum]